jgi:hypothetical protein
MIEPKKTEHEARHPLTPRRLWESTPSWWFACSSGFGYSGGPTPIAKASQEGHSFISTFQGGSVVRM